MGETRYDIIVHGDDDAVTQFIISFAGVPVEGMEYELTDALVENQPMIRIFPETDAPAVVSGTLTFTTLATETDELLVFDMRLELETGKLEGCIRTPLSATDDGSSTGDTSGGTADTSSTG